MLLLVILKNMNKILIINFLVNMLLLVTLKNIKKI